MSVRTELVKETLVGRICDRVIPRLTEELPPAVAGALDEGLRSDDTPNPSALSATMTRAGYFTRVVEAELFEPARSEVPGLTDTLRDRLGEGSLWPSAAAAVARDLASREPLERPAPDDADAASWRVPGPGGHVRHYVARRLVAEHSPSSSTRPADEALHAPLKRDFMYGFLIRCCEEALPPS
jgi:hypothetical protein